MVFRGDEPGEQLPVLLRRFERVGALEAGLQHRDLTGDLMGLPASALKPAAENSVGLTPMTLTLGPDFKTAGTPIAAPTKAPADIQRVEADKSVCSK